VTIKVEVLERHFKEDYNCLSHISARIHGKFPEGNETVWDGKAPRCKNLKMYPLACVKGGQGRTSSGLSCSICISQMRKVRVKSEGTESRLDPDSPNFCFLPEFITLYLQSFLRIRLFILCLYSNEF
jgi:hypothetical protein